MKRRTILAQSAAAVMFPSGFAACGESPENANSRDYYELQKYFFESEEKRKIFDRFMTDTAIPAMNRIGIKPVGIFYPQDTFTPVYVLRRFKSLELFIASKQKLLDDEEYCSEGAEFLNISAEDPVYSRVESSFMSAFSGIPFLETPVDSTGRIFQLRIYESPSVKTGLKKIEMFNTAEIDIFRKTGLNPVFFGETLIGEKMPNLTYMLVFENMQEQSESWKRFGSHPEWLKLRSLPQYNDKKILCGITNIFLTPAAYSQI